MYYTPFHHRSRVPIRVRQQQEGLAREFETTVREEPCSCGHPCRTNSRRLEKVNN